MPAWTKGTLAERFWRDVVTSDDGCWSWNGAHTAYGYGCFRYHNKAYLCHRVSYELAYGPLPAGQLARHRCDNPGCCRPDHLLAGTHKQNIADARSRGRLATGLRAGAHTRPASLPTGQRNGNYTHPETRPRGEQHWTKRHPERISRGPRSRMTWEGVREMRAQAATGTRTMQSLAAEYGVSTTAVSQIVHGHTWRE